MRGQRAGFQRGEYGVSGRCRSGGYVSEAPDRERARARRPRLDAPQGSRHLAVVDLGAGVRRGARLLGRAGGAWAQARRQDRDHRQQPAAALLGDVRRPGARRRAGADLCGHRSPTRWPMCSSTPSVTVAVVENQEQVDKVLSIADRVSTLRHMVYDEPRGLRDYDRAKLSWIDDVQKVGRDKLADPARLARWEASVAQGQGRRPRGDPLHLGHDRAAEGRDAHLRQHHHLGAQRQPLRQARRERGNHRLSAARLGRRPPVLLRAALCRGLLRQLPGGGRDRGGGPARDRHHLRVRAAARLREPADAHDGAHGGCRRAQAQDVPLLHRSRAQVGREDPQQGAGAAERAADLPARRRSGLRRR